MHEVDAAVTEPPGSASIRGGALRWLWLSAVVVALDQLTKGWAETALVLHQPLQVVPSFNLTLVYNQGAAFSFLSDAGGWQRWLFSGLALAVSLAIVWWLRGLDRRQRLAAVGLALILGGALGNLWDRVLLGHVIDFVDVYYATWHWPAFNIADSAITVGAVLMIVDAMFGRQPEERDDGTD